VPHRSSGPSGTDDSAGDACVASFSRRGVSVPAIVSGSARRVSGLPRIDIAGRKFGLGDRPSASDRAQPGNREVTS
jgi:hypothetical protein